MSIDMPDASAVASSTDATSATEAAQSEPEYRLTITKVTSYLFLTTRKRLSFVGTKDELLAQYRKVRTHNLMLGWWGIPAGLVWTPMTLARNAKALEQLNRLSAT